MKKLCALIALTLTTGCSDFMLALKSVQSIYSDRPQSKVVKKASVDKNKVDKPKTLAHLETTPPLSTQESDFAKSLNLSSTNNSTIPAKKFSPSKVLKVGSRGKEVMALEKRLAEFHYDVGSVDGFYDRQTRQGVIAFQKYNQLKRTGTYTLETQKALYMATTPVGLYPEAGLPRIEIDLARQVLLFFDEQGLNRVIPVSTGSNRKYCEISKKSGKKVCGDARTPRGKFHIQRRISGWRESDLGKLYNPLYFNGGFAIHGSPSVPSRNVSHGCVRIPIATAIWFYHTVQNDTPVIVFD